MLLIHQLLERTARRLPDKVAVICGENRLTYAAIDMASGRLAAALMQEGVRRGDRVAIYLDNSVEAVIAIFGVCKAGAAFSAINPSTRAGKLAYMLRDEGAVALITTGDSQRRRVMQDVLVDAPVPLVVWVGAAVDQEPPPGTRFRDWDAMLRTSVTGIGPSRAIDLDLGTIIYTSGTTGNPKGVMSAHHDMVFAAGAINAYLEHTEDDVIFCCLSLAFTYGLYQLFTAVQVGATLVLEKNFVFPARALEIMRQQRVTGFPGVPTMFALLLGLKNLAAYELHSLRYITNAAAPLPVQHVRQLRALFPGVRFFSMYGQTECKRTCYLPPDEVVLRPGSVGVPIPGTETYVVDEDGNRVPPGTVGELVVRGRHVMQGYWGQPEETARRLRPGPIPGERVLHTGDLFRMDDEGFLYFVSREDDIIKSRGEKVSPNEIENALHGLDGVEDVAAVGVPDPIMGEAVKVFIVLGEGATLSEREIRRYCARRLEDFMVPKYVEFRSELPKSGNGKTVRKELRSCVA